MIEHLGDLRPVVAASAYVHPTALLIADVVIGDRVTVWPYVVLRGDNGFIHIGDDANIQDGTIAHGTSGLSTTTIGARVTVGHRCILHGCTVMDDSLVGMGATLLDNCVVEPYCIVAAGALVPYGRRIPERSLVMGSPARVVRRLSDEDIEHYIVSGTHEYGELLREYRLRDGLDVPPGVDG